MERIVEVIQRIQGESKRRKKDERLSFKTCDLTVFMTHVAVVISVAEQEKHASR